MVEKYQYAVVILTAVVGIYGTYFDFKKDNKITVHGVVAIALLVCLCAVTLTLESKKHEADRLASEKSRKLAEQANKRLERTLLAVQESSGQLVSVTKSLKDIEGTTQKATLALRDLLEPLETMGFSFSVRYPAVQELFPAYGSFIHSLAERCVDPEVSLPPEYCNGVWAGQKEVSRVVGGTEVKLFEADYSYATFSDDSPAFKAHADLLRKEFTDISSSGLETEFIPWFKLIREDTSDDGFQYQPESSISFNFVPEGTAIRSGPDGRIDLNRKMYTDLAFGEGVGQESGLTRIEPVKLSYDVRVVYERDSDTLFVEFDYLPLDIVSDNEHLRSKRNLIEPGVGKKRLLYLESLLPYNPELFYVKIHYGLPGSSYHHISGDRFIDLNGPIDAGRFSDNRWVAVIDDQLID